MNARFEDQPKQPTWVRCSPCGHVWPGMYTPLPMMDAVKIMKNLCCPKCAADSKQITLTEAPEKKPIITQHIGICRNCGRDVGMEYWESHHNLCPMCHS